MLSKKLDNVDRKILSQLDKNCRISYKELGKKTRISKETVKYRIKTLQNRGIIQLFYTLINFSKINYVNYRLYLKFQNTSVEIENNIIQYLNKKDEIFLLYEVNGPFNIAMAIFTKDEWGYQRFWEELKKKFGAYFSYNHFSVMMEYTEFSRTYLSPTKNDEKKVFKIIKESNRIELDNKDYLILSILSTDARTSIAFISRSIGISTITTRQRLKKLLNERVIIGFRAALDLQKLGREYYKVDIRLSRYDNINTIKERLFSHPEVTYSERTSDISDIEVDIETMNFDSFNKIMTDFKKEFPFDFKEYSYYSMTRGHKIQHTPKAWKKLKPK